MKWLSLARADAPVLVGFHGGDSARAVESADPRGRRSGHAHPGAMFGELDPDPAGCRTTAWSQDPFARGSYSYPAVEGGREVRAALQEPIADRVFLAGEATDPDYAATVHGAYRSGATRSEPGARGRQPLN